MRTVDDPEAWERVFEVRDKPVGLPDVYLFGEKALAADVREAAVVAVLIALGLEPRRRRKSPRLLGASLALICWRQ